MVGTWRVRVCYPNLKRGGADDSLSGGRWLTADGAAEARRTRIQGSGLVHALIS